MDRQFSLAYLTIPGVDPVEHIRIAKQTGYDLVGLRTIPLGLPGEPEFLIHKDPALFRAVREALEYYDMKVLDIELARIHPDLDIRAYDPAFEAAAALGATDVLGSVWTRDRGFYTDQVGQVAEMAAKYGLNYNVEFLPWAGVRNLQEAITLVESLSCDNLFIMPDTLHAGRVGVTPQELKRADPALFRYVHLCDGPVGDDGEPVLNDIRDERMLRVAREERLYPGEGVMKPAELLAVLPEIPVALELPNLKRMQELGAEGHARRCLETAKACLQKQN